MYVPSLPLGSSCIAHERICLKHVGDGRLAGSMLVFLLSMGSRKSRQPSNGLYQLLVWGD